MLGNWIKRLNLVLPLVAVLSLLGGCSPPRGELLVVAAASLDEAFVDIAASFEARHGIRVDLGFGPSPLLAAQILAGAEADVFASADLVQMDRVTEGLHPLPGPPAVFASNRMVVVASAEADPPIRTLADLARPGVRLVLGGERVPAGTYARDLLADHSLLAGALANLVSSAPDVRDVLSKVASGEAEAGIVYRTDVKRREPGLRVIETEGSSARPTYPAVALSDDPLARVFVAFLAGPEGRAILAGHGFEIAR